MKLLLAGIVLIVVVGLGGFVYRNALEHRSTPTQTACTLEAKICPDGTTARRTGPSCAFAPCLPPNASVDALGIAFALPAGYSDHGSTTLVPPWYRMFTKSASSTDSVHAIVIRDYAIPTGSTTDEVILANTLLEPSDMPPKDMSAFSPKIIGTRTFLEIVTSRFEAVVSSSYFLIRKHDVLEFEIIERDVINWTSPSLIPDNLPQHQALIKMLGTLEDSSMP